MKKIFALVLVLAMVCSLGTAAFAAESTTTASSSSTETASSTSTSSPTKEDSSEDTTAATPVVEEVVEEEEDEEEGLLEEAVPEIEEAAENEIPFEDVVILPVADADELEEEDKAAFLEAYDRAKNIKDRLVNYLFWFDVPAQYTVSPLAPYFFNFRCPGEGVAVEVNGNDMEVKNLEGDLYQAALTETGAVMITSDLPAEG